MEQIIDGFLKSDREMVVGEISDFRGKVYAHLRIMVPSAAEEGEWRRTTKGVAIEASRVRELLEGIRRLPGIASAGRVVASIPVGRDEILVGVDSFRGDAYAYVRRFYKAGNEWKPTPKGVSVRTEFIDELIDLAERLATAAGQSD